MVALWASRAWSGASRFSARSSSPLEALRMPEIWFSRSCSLTLSSWRAVKNSSPRTSDSCMIVAMFWE